MRVDTTGRTIDEALDDVLVALKASGHLDLTGDDLAPAARTATAGGPSGTPATSSGPLRVLFVCTANICRSPYLELRARQLLADDDSVTVASAGTHGFEAHPMDDVMGEALTAHGVDADAQDGFRSRPLTRELIDEADLVLTAETSHRTWALDEVPGAFRKVFTLGQFAASVERADAGLTGADLVAHVGNHRAAATAEQDVPDPYRRGPDAAARCADQIDGLLATILPRLSRKAQR
ncbi:arsenate reductase/protein-tyrosine-phosphatase family protein [Nocardioides sambongensis]|uniref:arsenate reductase/protein-tyrosine-phosphatase family protein n=1 Tax=Nocardioides sambongensis TaxID=2589074 RepID=UPI001E4C7F6B|nr:hypothetical protein [Nocardioides sambongensis]